MTKTKLYILPFDHRGSFIKMFGFNETALTPDVIAKLVDYKHVVYEGFLKALEIGAPKDAAAILVDEQFGAKIHEEARALGVTRLLTIEKSGQDEFDFEYGDAFGEHIEKLAPDYAKVLVRYNPEGDRDMNVRQMQRLKSVGDFCKSKGFGFLFELLAVVTPAQFAALGGDQEKYEKTLRWRVMVDSIRELHAGGIEPDVWKLEGLADFDQMKAVVEATREGGRDRVGVIVLGRGESEEKVREWLKVAAKISGVIGFAVGRTVFKPALMALHEAKTSREEAIETIAKNYKGFVDLFESARG
ncbi:MAG: DUF2090 domain-containing protein [Parcubacteria group bacterium]|nr:DUF2090 domain-containing protein [Parcubacteria group bacterium]